MKNVNQQMYLYAITLALAFLAKQQLFGISLEWFWIPFLPVATAASIYTFDWIVDLIDLKQDENRHLILAILGAGFSISLAIFLK